MNIILFFIFFIASWDHFWPIVPAPDDKWGWLWSNWWNEDWQGKPKYSEKTCPSATLSTTNPTWPDPGLNPGRHGGKGATNRLGYGAAPMNIIKSLLLMKGSSKFSSFRQVESKQTYLNWNITLCVCVYIYGPACTYYLLSRSQGRSYVLDTPLSYSWSTGFKYWLVSRLSLRAHFVHA
jgi:hypothetical protein